MYACASACVERKIDRERERACVCMCAMLADADASAYVLLVAVISYRLSWHSIWGVRVLALGYSLFFTTVLAFCYASHSHHELLLIWIALGLALCGRLFIRSLSSNCNDLCT